MGVALSTKTAMTTWAAADEMHVLASGADYRMTLEDLFTEIVVSPVVKTTNRLYFRDTGLSIFSQADSYLNIVSDGATRLGDAVPSNYTQFDSTGHQTMVGTARPWRDQLSDALNIQKSGTGVSLDVTEGTVDFAYNAAYHATFTSADALYLNVQLNHDKDLTSSIYPHIHWFQTKNYIPNFLLEYRWQINLGTKVTSWTKLPCINPAVVYTSGTINQICYASAISVPVGTTLSDIIQFRIYRDTGNVSSQFAGADPYNTGGNATASILAFDVHFQINSLGSTDEYTK
jgi:hypothetical protein